MTLEHVTQPAVVRRERLSGGGVPVPPRQAKLDEPPPTARCLLSCLRTAVLAVALVPAAAWAQVSNNQIAYAALMSAPVGSWADYLITKHGETTRVRYSLIARDKKRVALDVDSQTPVGRVVVRMEFAPDPKEADRWNLSAARMHTPDGEVKEMPVPSRAEAKSASFGKTDRFGERLGVEAIAVAAGKRSATHYRRATTDVWVDEHLVPVGMVKLTDGEGGVVELAASGSGGKSGF